VLKVGVHPSPDEKGNGVLRVGLYTILQLPIFGLTRDIPKEGRKGGRVLRNSLSIVLHSCGAIEQGGAMPGWLTSARKLWSEHVSCKGQIEGEG